MTDASPVTTAIRGYSKSLRVCNGLLTQVFCIWFHGQIGGLMGMLPMLTFRADFDHTQLAASESQITLPLFATP